MKKSSAVERSASTSGFHLKRGLSVGYLLRDTSRLLLRVLQVKIEQHDVTLGQYFLLRELWEEEGMTQRELSTRVKIMEPSTVAALDAMEKRDLVVRVRSKLDRRKIHVYLTARGRSLRDELLGYAEEVNQLALRGIPAAQVAELRATLRAIKSNLADVETSP